VIPYGFPSDGFKTYISIVRSQTVLFVGVSTQKDFRICLRPFRDAKELSLTVVGHKQCQIVPLNETLDQHNWIPSLSHDQVPAMRDTIYWCSLPYLRGFGLVQAMSQRISDYYDRTAGPNR
jgi:hypothetical protein